MERSPGESSRRVVAHALEHPVGLEDPAVEAERHDADRGRLEDRAIAPLAGRERVLGVSAVGDVDHDALPVHAAAGLVLDHRCLLADPDDVPVAGDHAVLGEEGRERAPRLRVGRSHPLRVVGMEDLQPELVVGQPRLARIAEHVLDLGADVEGDRVGRIVGLDEVHVGDDPGDVLDQRLELAFRARGAPGRRQKVAHSRHAGPEGG